MKKIIVLCIMCFSVSLHASYPEALKLFEAKKYKESLQKIASVLETKRDLEANSPNYKLRFLAAHCHWNLSNLNGAVSHFSKCMLIQKTNPDAYIDLALCLIDNNKYTEALETARRGLKVKEHAMLYYVMGKVYFKWSNFAKAKEYYEKANSIDSALFIVYHDLGIALLMMKKYSEANTAFSAALSLNQKSAEIKNNLALSYEMLNKKEEAKKYYREAQAALGTNETVKKNAARINKQK